MICGLGAQMPPPHPDSCCCYTWAHTEGESCSCWEPIFDHAPAPTQCEGPSATQPSPCGDCAYVGLSPERLDGTLDAVGLSDTHPFYCHQGTPLVVEFRHPDGSVASPWPRLTDYRPVQIANRVWRADGQPALLCAGWAAQLARLERSVG